MSRRKQAKPRLWKREEEGEGEGGVEGEEDEGNMLLNVTCDNCTLEDFNKQEVQDLNDDIQFSVISLSLVNADDDEEKEKEVKLEAAEKEGKEEEMQEEEEEEEEEDEEEDCSVIINESGDEHGGFKEDKYMKEENLRPYSPEYLFRNSQLKDDDRMEQLLLDDENSLDSDTLGTEGGSSWVSEDHTNSPGSSCATPNSTTEGPDCELSFTVGITDGTPHACRFCDKAFPKQSYLKKHEQTHADCMPFHCEYCRRLFKHKRSRDRHIKLHTGDRKYKCTQCDAAFSRSDHLKIHMKTHDHQKPFQCTVCNRGYNTAAALTSHMQNHKRSLENTANPAGPPGTTFKCLQCPEIFCKPEELQNHMNLHQPSDTTSNCSSRSKSSSYPTICLTCTYCTKDNFATMEALQSHVQSVHKSIVNGNLHQRDLVNNQQKSPCVAATSIPSTRSSSSPAPLHTSSLPSYYCELCTIRFSSLQALHKHTTTMHGLSSNAYNSLKYLMMPELTNNGKLYCVYCAMHFLTPTSFAEHYIIFHGPYPLHLLRFPPTEQIKPTDLSIGRKVSSLKRTLDGDEQMSPKKKYNKTSENVSVNSTVLPHNSHRYDYSGPLICNQCMAAFTDFESFRAHIKLHMEETNGGLLGGGTSPEWKRTPVEFTCPHCRSVFSSSEEISQHVMAHFLATSTAYSCETCPKPFQKADELQKHLMDAHAQLLYSCSICNEVFDSKATIQVHFASRHSNEAKVYRCAGCPTTNKMYHSELEFATHVKTVHTSSSSLSTPFNTHHNTSVVGCMICQMSFSSELDMQLHLATHGKQFQCTVCPQSFHIEYLLDKHMQTHQSQTMNGNCNQDAGVKDLSPSSRLNSPINKMENGETRDNFICCDICEKSEFSNENDLMAHRKLHHHKHSSPSPARLVNDSTEDADDRTKPSQKAKTNLPTSSPPSLCYDGANKNVDAFNGGGISKNNVISCEACEKQDFASEAELQSHRKLVHHVKLTSPGKVSLHCAYCNESCKSRSDLEKHMKSHSQNSSTSGKHKCIICDEMCPTAAILAEHKLTHCKVLAGKTCMQCKGSITTEEQFYSHIQQHSSANCNNINGKNGSNNTSQLILPTVCVICRQTLVSEMEARVHARFHLHQSADLAPCSVCFQMSVRQDLVADICRECYQKHGKCSPFRCPECHVKFDSGTAIDIHLATVHRKSYQCIKCQMSFDNEKEIQHHVATHVMLDELNGHECRLCRLVLPSSVHLQRHLIEHTFAGCAAFTCYLCQSVFTTAQGLQGHIQEHGLAARPYDCSQCKQKFFFTSELEHHNFIHLEEMATHEGQNYYYQDKAVLKEKSPPTCYPSNSSLALQEVTFNSEASSKYNCSECKVEFCCATDFYEHNKTHFQGQNDSKLLENGDHKRRYTFNEVDTAANQAEVKNVSLVEIKVECKAQNDECESEDEQIDVVTTKSEDVVVGQNDKTE